MKSLIMPLLAAFIVPACLLSQAPHAFADSYTPDKAAFAVRVRGEEFAYRTSPLFVLPNESVSFEIPRDVKCRASAGSAAQTSDSRCSWKAPSVPGEYRISLEAPQDKITFHAFVMVPFSELRGETLNGYRIGAYPEPKEIHDHAAYELPRGFIEVTPANHDMLLTPHFSLGQFLCKEESGYPKYVVLKEQLLIKLEHILEELNRGGLKASSFVVMSGYRTPYYNQKIDNVRYSQHVFGDAADVYLPHDSAADYERHGMNEVTLLSRLVENLEQRPFFRRFIGGMGIYHATTNHPPFLHVDVRGWRARW